MDDIREIENKVMIAERDCDNAPSPNVPSIHSAEREKDYGSAPVSVALDTTAGSIVAKAQERINSDRIVDKHAKALAKNADERIANEIERQNVENEKKKADNVISRKDLANKLYRIKQESKRLKKEQRHLSQMQKQEQRTAKKRAYWESHKDTLEQYGLHEGSSKIACDILLWLDGVKGFFNGLSKVSDALIKAIKWILIIGLITAGLMIVPATRNWILTLFGFIE